jgi:uncharacterized protein YggT (Ycf19 family)
MAQRDGLTVVVGFSRVLLWIVRIWVVIDLVLLFLAFVLQLFGANPNAGFAEWVYRSTERAMAPFRGLFEPIQLTDASVLNTSLLFAMIVYGFIALFVQAGIDWTTGLLQRRRYELARREQEAAAMAAAASMPPAYTAPTPAPQPTSPYESVVVPASADPGARQPT